MCGFYDNFVKYNGSKSDTSAPLETLTECS